MGNTLTRRPAPRKAEADRPQPPYQPPAQESHVVLHAPGLEAALRALSQQGNYGELIAQIAALQSSINTLNRKVDTMSGTQSQLDQDIQNLQQQTANLDNAEQAATVLINGFPQLIQNAVQQALAAGATPEQLQAINDVAARIAQNANDLAAAVVANTPANNTPAATP